MSMWTVGVVGMTLGVMMVGCLLVGCYEAVGLFETWLWENR